MHCGHRIGTCNFNKEQSERRKSMVILVVYRILGYWDTRKTTHANKIFMGYDIGELFFVYFIFHRETG